MCLVESKFTHFWMETQISVGSDPACFRFGVNLWAAVQTFLAGSGVSDRDGEGSEISWRD